jgi:hypothetical protein
VNAPFSWPKSSEEISDGARAAQFTLTKGALRPTRLLRASPLNRT